MRTNRWEAEGMECDELTEPDERPEYDDDEEDEEDWMEPVLRTD
jgi:hypothetical protein